MSGTPDDAPRSLGFHLCLGSTYGRKLMTDVHLPLASFISIRTHGKYEPMKDAHSLWFRCPR